MELMFEIFSKGCVFVVVVKIDGKLFFLVEVWNMKDVRCEVLDVVLRILLGCNMNEGIEEGFLVIIDFFVSVLSKVSMYFDLIVVFLFYKFL